MLDWLSPETALSGSVPSIIPLFRIFKDCFNGSLEVEALNREWRRLPFLKKELGEGKVSVLEFWNSGSAHKDGAGDSAFVHLPIFIKGIMSLPHSSASAERHFSLLKLVRTSSRTDYCQKQYPILCMSGGKYRIQRLGIFQQSWSGVRGSGSVSLNNILLL